MTDKSEATDKTEFTRLVARGMAEAEANERWLSGTAGIRITPFARDGLAHSFGLLLDEIDRLRAAAAPPPPSVPVGVKVLEWKDLSYKGELDLIAHTPFHTYQITKDDTCEWPFILRPFVSGQSNYTSMADAKAAAQADYEQCIMSAIIAPPSREEWRGANYAAEARTLMSEAKDQVEPIVGGPEGESIVAYRLPTGFWLMLQAHVRNLLDTLPPPSREEGLREAATAIDRFNRSINAIEARCMAVDGPVTPTLREMTETELADIWADLQTIRRALSHADGGE